MIKIEISTRRYVRGRGWCIDDKCTAINRFEMMKAGWKIHEEYVNDSFNRLYVLADDEAAAALFKLTFL